MIMGTLFLSIIINSFSNPVIKKDHRFPDGLTLISSYYIYPGSDPPVRLFQQTSAFQYKKGAYLN